MNTEQPLALQLALILDGDGPFNTEVANELRRMHALLNTPELINFSEAVTREAAHQRERFGDLSGKSPEECFGTVLQLAARVLFHSREAERLKDWTPESIAYHRKKAAHHCITPAAFLANWHKDLVKELDVDPAAVVAAAGVTANGVEA